MIHLRAMSSRGRRKINTDKVLSVESSSDSLNEVVFRLSSTETLS